MIQNQRELEQATEQISRMYRALAVLREEVLPTSREQFEILAEGPLDELYRLEAEVSLYCGRNAAEEATAELWLRISGDGLKWPEAPTSVVTNFLDTLRKGIQASAEWIVTGTLSRRPTKALKQACDLRVVAFQPGSLRIGISLPYQITDEGSDEQATSEAVSTALGKYLHVAAWAGSEDDETELARAIDDPKLQQILLTEVKRLVPRPRGLVESVELSGRSIPRRAKITLIRATHERIDNAIDVKVSETSESYEGDLREIDLDNCTFTLRNVGDGPFQVPCEFEADLYDTAVEALDRRVEVIGVRRVEPGRGGSGKLKVTRLVVLDREEDRQEG